MKLVSLKRESDDSMPEVYTSPQYGYGAEISITHEQAVALGIADSLRVGQKVQIQAIGIITRSSECLEDDGKEVSACIQLTDLGVELNGAADAGAAAKVLYGE